MKLNLGKLITGAIKSAVPIVVPIAVGLITAKVEKVGAKVVEKAGR